MKAQYTHRICYTKEMLSGTFAGMKIAVEFPTTADSVALHLWGLGQINRANVGRECVTGNEFVISGLRAEEIR